MFREQEEELLQKEKLSSKKKESKKGVSPLQALSNYRKEVYQFLNAPIVKFIYDKVRSLIWRSSILNDLMKVVIFKDYVYTYVDFD